MKLSNRVIAWIACVVCCVALLSAAVPGPVAAAENIDVNSECRLLIDCRYDDQPMAGVTFHVYRVADVSELGILSLAGDFAKYPVELNGLTSDEFLAVAETLYGYALLDDLKPDHTVTTDAEGKAALEDLSAGVYLVIGEPHETANGELVCDPMLVSLPYRLSADSDWVYDGRVQPKCSYDEDDEPRKIKVLKKWVDGGSTSRPASVTVNLLCDGKVHDSVVLSDANGWRHTWEGLDPAHSWTVVEEIPENYTVSIQKNGVTYLIVNSLEVPDETTTEPSEPTEPDGPDIPQTGLLWWPVPLLAVAGIGLIVAGIITRRDENDEA